MKRVILATGKTQKLQEMLEKSLKFAWAKIGEFAIHFAIERHYKHMTKTTLTQTNWGYHGGTCGDIGDYLGRFGGSHGEGTVCGKNIELNFQLPVVLRPI